jgi:hypothetical protein
MRTHIDGLLAEKRNALVATAPISCVERRVDHR